MPSALATGGLSTLKVLLLMAVALCMHPTAWAQDCAPPPEDPGCWSDCGECRGDLNEDGLLDQLDLLIFVLFRDQQPQNPCANFNGDCTSNGSPLVDDLDYQILNCLIKERSVLVDPSLPWNPETNPRVYGSCNTNIDPAEPSNCGQTTRSCLVTAVPSDPDRRGCGNPVCCQKVCSVSPFCCDVIWDQGCTNIAQNICYPDEPDTQADAGNCLCEHTYEVPSADCLAVHAIPGCSDSACSDLVCACDPLCCTQTWDQSCVDAAQTFCSQPCTNLILQEYVCETIPECCSSGVWDASCTLAAALTIVDNPSLLIPAFPKNCLLCPVDEDYPVAACNTESFKNLICFIAQGNPPSTDYCDPVVFDQNVSDCIQVVISAFPDLGCDQVWDAKCAQVASRLCRWPEPRSRGLGNCLVASNSLFPNPNVGCEDAYCSSLVCACDPLCCTLAWDQSCVDLAGTHCSLDPASDSDIIPGLPGIVVIEDQFGRDCGDGNAGSCFYQGFSPYCDDAACCQLICGYDGFCCEGQWDTLCAQMATVSCESSGKGICGPVPVTLNGVYPPPNGKNWRSCYTARSANFCSGYPDCSPAGCNDSECCNNVCYVDPFCCEIQWDNVCADGATALCPQEYPICGTILSGSCFIAHKQPYCDDGSCCEEVCIIDPACCLETWDIDCVAIAEVNCVSRCGDIYAGSCTSVHAAPGCADAECCESVCTIDSFCCVETWDSGCANIALANKTCQESSNCGSPLARSCYVSGYLPGCSDESCCEEICTIFDPWCCDVRWDAVCAAQAITACPPGGFIEGRDPCDVPHLTKACNVPSCSASVCSVPGLESCCEQRWDVKCVEAAEWLCPGLYECPGTGSCYETNDTPMCEDPACCNAVCTYDPLCCRETWDDGCASTALDVCVTPDDEDDWNCPCIGNCFEARPLDEPRPGCNDESCCASVCQIDPECCLTNWDESCASLAIDYCGGGLQCGSWTTGPCLEPGSTPYCDDPACCEAVCVIEPTCCSFQWDSICVGYAAERCLRGCGLAPAGSCYFPHLTPGCDDAECCETICEKDPVCCSNIWDGTCAEAAIKLCDPPECGDYSSGECCLPGDTPSCNDKRCCDAVCGIDPVCCELNWDQQCVEQARTTSQCECSFDCGDPCAGSCCIPNGTPSCNDEDCCDAVCAIDSYCCEVVWDISCAQGITGIDECEGSFDDPDAEVPCPLPQCGEPQAGSCCFPNGTPNCNDVDCCEQICTTDPSCCDVGWDSVCAGAASDPITGCEQCNVVYSCGSDNAGDCCSPHGNPFCDDLACCALVCSFDPNCCSGTWDQICAEIAQQQCAGCAGGFAPPQKPALKAKPKPFAIK